jgi:diaminopimelate epimerase
MQAKLMNGAGNAFLLADVRGRAALVNPSAKQVQAWAREFHFDQFLMLQDSDSATAFMRIWNADGDEVGACGNGARAAALALMDDLDADQISLGTVGGLLSAKRAGEWRASIDLGVPRFSWQQIPLAREMDTVELDFGAEAEGARVERPGAVNLGNPHAVFFVRDLDALPVRQLGHEIEFDPLFPERVNAGFAQIYDANHIRLQVWERGAGLTAACGTGACAAVIAAHRRGLVERSASVMADGGELHVEWRESDDHVILTGPVELEGVVEIAL